LKTRHLLTANWKGRGVSTGDGNEDLLGQVFLVAAKTKKNFILRGEKFFHF
jgi:hypothetical protein